MNKTDETQGSYPLSLLFIMLAFCGSLFAIAALEKDASISTEMHIGFSVSGSILGIVLGIIVGIYHHRRVRGVVWGIIGGTVFGLLCAEVAMVSVNAIPAAIVIAVVGSLIMVFCGTAVRANQRNARRRAETKNDKSDSPFN